MQEVIDKIKSTLEKVDGKEAAGILTEFKSQIKGLSDCVSKSTLLMDYAKGTRDWIRKKLEPFPANKGIREILENRTRHTQTRNPVTT